MDEVSRRTLKFHLEYFVNDLSDSIVIKIFRICLSAKKRNGDFSD